MARYPDDGLGDDLDWDGSRIYPEDAPLDEGGDLVEATEGKGPCDGVHDAGAGALACSVCYPDAHEVDSPANQARRDLDLYGMSAVEIDQDGTCHRVDPRFLVDPITESRATALVEHCNREMARMVSSELLIVDARGSGSMALARDARVFRELQRMALRDVLLANIDHERDFLMPYPRARSRVELARERRTRTALNHLARRARRRAKR